MSESRKRTPVEIEQHRATIAELYLRQHTQAEIAEKLGIDQSTVSRDLVVIQAKWRESALVDMNEAKQRELERIDQLEREYWQAWERSQEDAETVTKKQKSGNAPPELSLQKKGQTGDPRFLAGIERCIEMRAKILGINAPIEHKVLDWRSQAVADIKAGKIEFVSLAQTFDPDLATELFKLAGVPVDVT